MRVDVVNRREILHARILQCQTDCLHRACTGRIGGRNMVGIGGGGVSGQLAVNFRAAGLRVLLRLKDKHCRAFTHDKAVTVDVERPRSLLRAVVELRRKSAHLHESTNGELKDRRLRAARNYDVRPSSAHHVERQAKRVRRRRTGGHRGERGAFCTQCH